MTRVQKKKKKRFEIRNIFGDSERFTSDANLRQKLNGILFMRLSLNSEPKPQTL